MNHIEKSVRRITELEREIGVGAISAIPCAGTFISKAVSVLRNITEYNEYAESFRNVGRIICEKIDKGDLIRTDWFSENATEKPEVVIKQICKHLKDANEEKIKRHIEYFYANISLTSNSHINISTAEELLNHLETLTYRQLCFIRASIERRETGHLKNFKEGSQEIESYLSRMPEDKKSNLLSICRQIVELYPLFGRGVLPMLTDDHDHICINSPLMVIRQPSQVSKEIYKLAELSIICEGDMSEIFQYWE